MLCQLLVQHIHSVPAEANGRRRAHVYPRPPKRMQSNSVPVRDMTVNRGQVTAAFHVCASDDITQRERERGRCSRSRFHRIITHLHKIHAATSCDGNGN